jgi:glycosyltransferase involved in cell wall biosynthesis
VRLRRCVLSDSHVPRVLLVTGAFYPEISAAGLQCRAVASVLGSRTRFAVLTTAVDKMLPVEEVVDHTVVHRVLIDVKSRLSKASASVRLVERFARTARTIDLVHIHGFSQKNVPIAILARLLGKPVVQTLHTAGQDEPGQIGHRGWLADWAWRSAHLTISISPYLTTRYLEGGLPGDRLRQIANGVDTARFCPASSEDRVALRTRLGWPLTQPVIVYVGFFSRDKRPDLLFRAWRNLVTAHGIAARLVYIGATDAAYYEVDRTLAECIREDAEEMGRSDAVVFAGQINDVERYLRAADVFVLPSARESQSIALLEAMSCGLPVVASRLPGATDVIVDDGVNGRLFPVDDEQALTRVLVEVLSDNSVSRVMAERARTTVTTRYDIRQTAEQWLAVYNETLSATRRPGAPGSY